MAGAVADRELNTADQVRFAIATREDDDAIRRLLRENPMRGVISVTFEREPDYFRGVNFAGGCDRTIVAFAKTKLICMGRCTKRECWMNGRETRAGYLAELRLDDNVRGRFRTVRDGYQFFSEQRGEMPAELYFTSIATDNERALRLLENGARGMPKYARLAELATLLVAVPRRPRAAKLCLEFASQKHLPAMIRVLNDHARRHQLAAVWTTEKLCSLEKHGLPLGRFLLALDGGEIVACGALWDQRGFRQTVIQSYSRTLSLARPLLNAAGALFKIPRLPSPGSTLAHAFLSPLAFANGAENLLPDFVEAFFPAAQKIGLDFLTLALPAHDARVQSLQRRFSTRTWRSRLYRVSWPKDRTLDLRGTFFPDVALL